MRVLSFILDVVGCTALCTLTVLAALASRFAVLLGTLALSLLSRLLTMSIRLNSGMKFPGITVVNRGRKMWLTVSLFRMTFGIGWEAKKDGTIDMDTSIAPRATTNTKDVDSHTTVSGGEGCDRRSNEPQRNGNSMVS